MIMQPEWITQEIINEAIESTIEKKPELKNIISKLCFKKYKEGKTAQIMHLGPYSEESPIVKKVHKFIENKGSSFDGIIRSIMKFILAIHEN